MKTVAIAALLTLLCPLNLYAGAITYSGIPCKWMCAHDVADEIGPKKTDPVETREDHRIMRQISRASFPVGTDAAWTERGDGRLLLLDPQSYRVR